MYRISTIILLLSSVYYFILSLINIISYDSINTNKKLNTKGYKEKKVKGRERRGYYTLLFFLLYSYLISSL